MSDTTGMTQNEYEALGAFKKSVLACLPETVREILLFGSAARGEQNEESDIDLLIVVPEESLDIWDQIQSISSTVSLEYDVFLSVKILDIGHLERLKRADSPFIKNVLRDGKTLWPAA